MVGVAEITVANSAERELQTQFAFCITKPNLATQQMVRSKKQPTVFLQLNGVHKNSRLAETFGEGEKQVKIGICLFNKKSKALRPCFSIGWGGRDYSRELSGTRVANTVAFCITKPNLATQQMVRSKKQANSILVKWGPKK
ncbi:MAG TPA: hypothetical protein DCO89_01250 [Clostridiales bacterium]|nr:hypothetical protein [Clostridiales bacterium]